ncbi:MAG: TonB-dependent receptor plug domain-containing protein [Bacteroidetes bacterium]|nr:TonB-dependent receptor plug domain-containing protein [Bacteroidota bacterium]
MKYAILLLLASIAMRLEAQTNTFFKIQQPDLSAASGVRILNGATICATTDSMGNAAVSYKITVPELLQLQLEGNLRDFDVAEKATRPDGVLYVLILAPVGIEEAIVRATRAGESMPVARTVMSREEIHIQNSGRDIPVLLQLQPSVVVTTDAGAGVGYTGIRVRGSDATRTNITVNGVPINDAESQGTFWVNMPDLASSLQSIQIQRGVGTSTNGAGAFGASVNMQTANSVKPYGMAAVSAGSFRTMKKTLSAGTGLLANHWTMDMRLSQISSDGFVNSATSNLRSYLFSVGYQSKKWSAKLLQFSGTEKTYQAWWGVPVEKLNGTQTQLTDHYWRNAGVTYRNAQDSLNLFQSDPRRYNYYTYKNETDHYRQTHTHAYLNWQTGNHSQLAATLYLTHGEGYFEQWRPNDQIAKYNLPNSIIGTDTLKYSDVIRQRWLQNDLYGLNVNWNYQKRNVHVVAGAAYSQYYGDHFGKIIWARNILAANYESNYYNATGDKIDGNIFAKTEYRFRNGITAFADLQLRRVYHEGRGTDNDLRTVRFTGDYLFFNPKAGLFYSKGSHTLFASVAMANREPSRSDFTDNQSCAVPEPEQMTDFEAGYRTGNSKFLFEINAYAMLYKNQLVLTGAVNDVGTALRRNAASSQRAGVELSGAYRVNSGIQLGGNVAFSTNQIKSIQISIPDYFTNVSFDTVYKKVPIAYSPAITAGVWLQYNGPWHTQLRWVHKFVSRQYLDNTGNKSRSLEPYYFSELWLQKTIGIKNGGTFDLQFQVLNLFNSLYSSNGYSYVYTYGSPQRIQEVSLFPQAGRHCMGGIVFRF